MKVNNYEFKIYIDDDDGGQVMIQEDMEVKIIAKNGNVLIGGITAIGMNRIELDLCFDNVDIDIQEIEEIEIIENKRGD